MTEASPGSLKALLSPSSMGEKSLASVANGTTGCPRSSWRTPCPSSVPPPLTSSSLAIMALSDRRDPVLVMHEMSLISNVFQGPVSSPPEIVRAIVNRCSVWRILVEYAWAIYTRSRIYVQKTTGRWRDFAVRSKYQGDGQAARVLKNKLSWEVQQ